MAMDRREFLGAATGAGLGAAMGTAVPPAVAAPAKGVDERYARLGQILKQPVLKKELFRAPVIIESVELLKLGNRYLCRVRSKDGAEGISVAHNEMSTLYPIFLKSVRPFFLGKDARELDRILKRVYVYNFNFRYNGLALGLPLATLEFAVLDMLGRIAGKPVGQLIGAIHTPRVAIFVATEWREKSVAESIRLIQEAFSA